METLWVVRETLAACREAASNCDGLRGGSGGFGEVVEVCGRGRAGTGDVVIAVEH
jgi:hypothetical protein